MTVQMDGDPLTATKWMEVVVAPGRIAIDHPEMIFHRTSKFCHRRNEDVLWERH